jgi:hypothetical protein
MPMEAQGAQATGYMVPTYQAPPGTAWLHFLHGNVPRHQIDFIYRPEVPQPPLTRQHFSHLARLVKYIEPRRRSAYAFAIGNLSRDDTQYEPGHGAVALIFGLRIRGAHDHAGRQDPPFCHAAVAVDRHLDAAQLYAAAAAFYHQLLPDEESQAEGSGWYHTYVRYADNPDALVPLLRAYVADFDTLPAPERSQLGPRWVTPEGATPPKRVVIVYQDQASFESLAACAARIAGVLVESDVRWTVISNGREGDVPGGVSVRFVPAEEAMAEAADTLVLRLEDVPVEAEAIGAQLFAVKTAQEAEAQEPRARWRQRYEAQAAAEEISVEFDPGSQRGGLAEEPRGGAATAATSARGAAALAGAADQPREKATTTGMMSGPARERRKAAEKSRLQLGVLVAIGVVLALAGVVAAIVMSAHGSGGAEGVAASGSAASGSTAPGSAAAEVPTVVARSVPSVAASVAPSSAVAVEQKAAAASAAPTGGAKPSAAGKQTVRKPTPKRAATSVIGGELRL